MTFKCEICKAMLDSEYSTEANLWDWFTGYLPKTVHFCPQHRESRERDDLWALSRYPKAIPRFTGFDDVQEPKQP